MAPQFVDSWRETIRRWLWILAILWLGLAGLLIGYDWFVESTWPGWLTRIYLWATVLASLIVFAMYGWDKRQARLDRRRIPERTLHRLAAAGGWPGAILGQQYFRHKTEKYSFRFKSTVILSVHLLLVLWIVVRGVKNYFFAWI